jgi:O-antigen ligase
MAILERSSKPIAEQGPGVLFKVKRVLKGLLIGVLAIGLGILLGHLLSSPGSAELVVSGLTIVVVVLIIIHRPLNGVLIWLTLEPFIESWINIPLGAGIPDLSFSRFVVAFLAIFALARAATGKFLFGRIGLAEVGIVAMAIGMITSAPLAANPKGMIQLTITLYFVPLTVYFFAKNLVRDEKDLNRLLLTMTIFGFVAAAYAIFEQMTGTILFLPKGESADMLGTGYTENLRLIRGLLGRSGNFARVFTSTIPITFYLFFESKSVIRKALLVGMLLAQAFGIFITYNRTSWIALLVGLFILQFFYPQFRKVYLVIVVVAAVVLWVTWDQVNESAVVEERVNSKVSTLEGRESRWTAGFNMWRVKPLRGWGFGRYEEQSGRFRTDGERRNYLAIENDYLHILVGSGLVGFVPYLLFLLAPLVNGLRLFRLARASDWSGFVRPATIAVYWVVLLAFAIGSYTQKQTQPVVKMIPFALAGAVIGSHAHKLHGSVVAKRQPTNSPPGAIVVEKGDGLM